MGNKKRPDLIDRQSLIADIQGTVSVVAMESPYDAEWFTRMQNRQNEIVATVYNQPSVDAVEISDKQLLQAVKLLIKQYEHSKQSEYVHNPIAHAFFYTWKQLDRKENDRD